MAYAAVTSLKGTLHLHFLKSQPRLPLIYKGKMASLHRNLSFLQESLEKSEMAYDDAGEMKDVEAEIRDAAFEAEERIEMELTTIYLEAKSWTKRVSCLLRLHGIFKEAVKQTNYLKKKLIKIQSEKQLAKGVERLFSHFKLLRVVDIERITSHEYRVLYAFANLIHLRYLALRHSTNIFSFSLELFEHSNIQSFIVYGGLATVDSPKAYGIWKMPLLRNLFIEQIVSLETSPVVHRNLESISWLDSKLVHRNLESISWLDSKLCTKDLFTRIPNLKKLGIDGIFHENNQDCFHNFVHLRHLEELSIIRWGLLDRIPCSGISWATSFLPNLKKLKFFWTSLAWSDMKLIGMLPNLEVLKLKRAIAREHTMWEPSEEGFRQLKRLVIEDRFLQHWNVVGDHFPVLECLELSECLCLEEIPSGFVDITTLALIQLNCCRDTVLASAKLIQKEQYNNYGNAFLVRSENICVATFCRVKSAISSNEVALPIGAEEGFTGLLKASQGCGSRKDNSFSDCTRP
nr:putative late blight resistance protein homolog R1A-4 [Ipomoea batatas]